METDEEAAVTNLGTLTEHHDMILLANYVERIHSFKLNIKKSIDLERRYVLSN